MNRYARGITLTYATQIIVLMISFATNILIVRALGPEGKGIVALLQNYFLILVVVFILGMSEGNIFYLSNRQYRHKDIFANVLLHTAIVTCLVVILSMLLKGWIISNFLKNIDGHYYDVALWIFPAFFLFLHTTTMLLGHKNIVGFNAVTITRFLLIFVFMILLIPRFRIGGALTATVVGFFAADTLGVLLLGRHGAPAAGINIGYAGKALVFGMKSEVGLILSQIDRRLDIFIINLFLTPAQVGFYAVAVAVAEFPWYISNAIATVLFPEIAGMNKNDAHEFTAYMCRNTLFIVLIVSGMLMFVGGILISAVFGAEFWHSVPSLRLLIPGVVMLSVNKVLCAGFSGTGRPEYGTMTAVFSAVVTVGLDFLLIPRMGIAGAAIASTIAYTISAITGITLFARMSKLSPRKFLVVTRADITKYPQFYHTIRRRIRHA